jgi:hypothetical protein
LGILVMEVMGIWCLLALVTGLALGATIRNGERVHKEVFLACLFSAAEAWQSSQKQNRWPALLES